MSKNFPGKDYDYTELKTGDRFIVPDWIGFGFNACVLVRKTATAYIVADLLNDGTCDPAPYRIPKAELIGKRITVLSSSYLPMFTVKREWRPGEAPNTGPHNLASPA